MLRHVVLLRLDDGADAAMVERIADALRALPDSVPSIRDYCVGVDQGLAEGNAQLSVVALFDDEAGYAEYRDHPDHVAIIDRHIRPVLAGRMATQYSPEPPRATFA